SLERTVDMMQHRSELWQAEIAWVRHLRERELELAGQASEQSAADVPSPPVIR
ncbi:MAG: hypothetical protein IMW89_22730, partial [Ktedonobacteraceae bacterium]|nr:hypothetical protein [Ktedonobacteraceae bacterium]